MRRGNIVAVSLDPARGSEASKSRPAVVVSNDAANATASRLARGVITVVPITSNVARIYPFQVPIRPGSGKTPKRRLSRSGQSRSSELASRLAGFPLPPWPSSMKHFASTSPCRQWPAMTFGHPAAHRGSRLFAG